jgi:hypothetical protein
VIRDHLDHAVLGHQPVARREVDADCPFFPADLVADRFVDLDRWSVHRVFLEGASSDVKKQQALF